MSQPASGDQSYHPRAPSALQSTIKTEATHKITQSTFTKSISHNNSHTGARQTATKSKADEFTLEAQPEKIARKSSGNTWSVLNSVDDGSSLFGMPAERSAAEKKADSLQLVMELIEKVNAQQSDFATADSKALKQVHTELTKISQLVRNFLEYSTTLINDEGNYDDQSTSYSRMCVLWSQHKAATSSHYNSCSM